MRSKLIVIVCVLAATTCYAQWDDDDRSGIVAVGGGFATPNSDELDLLSDSGYSIAGYAARAVNGPFGWRVEAAYSSLDVGSDIRFLCERDDIACDDPSLTSLQGGVQVGGFGTGPYAMVTAGLTRFKPAVSDAANDFGMGFGSGVNWMLAESWGVGFDFKANAFWPEGDGGAEWYTTINILAAFRF